MSAVNFSPYQPPPDVPSTDPPSESSSSLLGGRGKGKSKRPWFTRDASSYGNSYQSGGSISDPTSASQAYSNDPESQAYSSMSTAGYSNGSAMSMGGTGSGDAERANAWESRFGWRVDIMGAVCYLGGPVTALIFLILETQNDYVRFHAYQSALLTTPIIILHLLFVLIIPVPTFLQILIFLGWGATVIYTAYRAWKDGQEGLGRFYLPYIGEIAERWVGEE